MAEWAEMDNTPRPQVLLVEDDRQLGPLIVELLDEDFDVTLVPDGQQGLHLGLTRDWDVMVIDRGLPLLEGTALIEALRRKRVAAPILMLTALGSIEDKVEGLDAGANDYLVKPFNAAELAARLRALTRSYTMPDGRPDVGGWSFDASARFLVSPYGDRVALSPREAALLSLLARDPERVFSRDEILAAVFDRADQAGSVDTYVHYLRKKLGHSVVRTVRGAGYRIGEPA
jgi:two-component system, OmpR family, response regulator QseB